MNNDQQFEQLIFQYEQLKSGSEEIKRLIEREDYDSAITMLKNREPLFLNCKCMRRYLVLNEVQEKKLEALLNEIRALESSNIELMQNNIEQVKAELKQANKAEKIQQAYDFNEDKKGSILNYIEE